MIEIGRNGVDNLPPDLSVLIWRNLASIVSKKLRSATAWRSAAIDRDRNNTLMLRRFLNSHQQGLIRAQGPLSADHLPSKLEHGRFVLVFTDVVGFSRLALTVSAEETAEMIRSCMQVQADALESANGFVDKFMGDGLMAYFHIPLTATDQDVQKICASALDAALEANERVKALHAGGESLGLRIGLHLGEALAGNFGSNNRMQVTLIGKDVNTAARLEQAKLETLEDAEIKELGDIRASEEFFRMLPHDRQKLMPYEAVVKAKQGNIPLRSGPPRFVIV